MNKKVLYVFDMDDTLIFSFLGLESVEKTIKNNSLVSTHLKKCNNNEVNLDYFVIGLLEKNVILKTIHANNMVMLPILFFFIQKQIIMYGINLLMLGQKTRLKKNINMWKKEQEDYIKKFLFMLQG
jgi:hypothetical protein